MMCVESMAVDIVCYTMWIKNSNDSVFKNSEKLVQILLEFGQQIVEGYEFVLAKFR